MQGRRLGLGIAACLGCFALGVGAARWLGQPPPAGPGPVEAPRIFIDAGAVDLLPDASLRLTLPAPPAVGSGPAGSPP